MPPVLVIYARFSHIRQVTRERIHEQRCIHIQQQFIADIRHMMHSPFISYNSYRICDCSINPI